MIQMNAQVLLRFFEALTFFFFFFLEAMILLGWVTTNEAEDIFRFRTNELS